jgi:hypothetical protein
VRRVALDHAAEGDDAGVASRLRERHRGDRQLERARDGHHRDRVACDAGFLELRERAFEQPRGDGAVEAADDDADGAAAALRPAFEHAVPLGHAEVARRVLAADVVAVGNYLLGLAGHLGLGRLVLLAGRVLDLRRVRPALAHSSAPS